MPQIPQQYLDCSIYLYDSRKSAEDGENFGGSGCLVRVEADPVNSPIHIGNLMFAKNYIYFPEHIYAVTNKHVVQSGFNVIRLNTVDDQIDVLELDQRDWIPHPDGDDLVVAPINLPKDKYKYFSLNTRTVVHPDSVTLDYPHSSVGAGDDTFMVGRFISHAGKQRNTPALRFGSIAMLPFEKVKLENGHMQEAFLVETRSISGYSGSPVFVYKPKMQRTHIAGRNPYEDTYSTSIVDLMGNPILLGIDCGHVRQYRKIVDGGGRTHPHGWKVESNTGMAIVIPAWRLINLLNIKALAIVREQKDEQWLEQKEAEAQSISVAFDVEKPESFTKENYQEALKRASRKISSPDEGKNKT